MSLHGVVISQVKGQLYLPVTTHMMASWTLTASNVAEAKWYIHRSPLTHPYLIRQISIIGVIIIKEDGMEACSPHGRDEKYIQNFDWKT